MNKCPFCGTKPDGPLDYHIHEVVDFEGEFTNAIRLPACYETEITRLKGLVREMVPFLEQHRGLVQDEFKAKTPFIDEILTRPEVREIMEGK